MPLAQVDFQLNYDLGYEGDTLDSLDILDALGTYDFDGLTRFGFNIWRLFPDNIAMEIDWSGMTIAEGGDGDGSDGGASTPATSTWGAIALILLVLGVSGVYLRRRIA